MSKKAGRSLTDFMAKNLAPAEPAAPQAPEPRETSAKDVVAVAVLVVPEDRRRIRQLALNEDISIQKLGHEAWNLLLTKYGLPPLEPASANVPSGRKRV